MIGTKIRELRKNNKLTLEELADALNQKYPNTINFNKGKISKWENNKEEPRLSSVKIIADFFDVPLDYFNVKKGEIAIAIDVPREPFSTNIIHGDNHGINGLDAGSGNTYNFGVNDNIDSHNESMKAIGIADMKMSRALLNAQNETVKKLDRIIELLEEQNKILKK